MLKYAPISPDVREAVQHAVMKREQAKYPNYFIAVAVGLTVDDNGNIPVVITRAETIVESVPPAMVSDVHRT